MKTAMQELIEIINDNLINEFTSQEFARLTIFKASAERLLEKEKEQLQELKDKIESLQYELKEERDY